jgi:hypothetical protein
MNSVPGVSIAAALLVLLTEKLRVIQDYRFFLYGLLVVAMLIFRPWGLVPASVGTYFADLRARIGRAEAREVLVGTAAKEGQRA